MQLLWWMKKEKIWSNSIIKCQKITSEICSQLVELLSLVWFQKHIWKETACIWVCVRDRMCHSTKKPVTTMLTYPWKCTVLYCNHLGNTWKPLVLMTQHFDYCPRASEGDSQSVRSSAPVVSRCVSGGYNVKLYISRGRLAWWLLAFLQCVVWPECDMCTYLLIMCNPFYCVQLYIMRCTLSVSQ